MNEFILVLPRLWPRYLGDPEHPFITKGGHYSSLLPDTPQIQFVLVPPA